MNRTYQTIPWNFLITALSVMMIVTAVISPLRAQDAEEPQVEELIPAGIPPLSNRVALLSIPLSVYPFNEPNKMPTIRLQELAELTLVLEDKTTGRLGLNIEEDFLALSAAAINSGLALYKESESQLGFNYSVEDQSKDLPIDLLEKPTITADPAIPGRYTVKFRPVPGSANVQLPFFKDQFADFYVVARTSLNLMHGDRFEAYIPANGIKIRDNSKTLPKDTLYDDRFPSDAFADLNPAFAVAAIFEGDIVQIVNFINDTGTANRLEASSAPKTLLGLDMVSRADKGYFLEEVRVNFLAINLRGIARLMENLTQQDTSSAGIMAMFGGGMEQVGLEYNPTFFYSPWFYNTPIDMETGMPLTTVAPGDGETLIPMTMPLDLNGFPRQAFMIGADNSRGHYTRYVAYGPGQTGAAGMTPRIITPDIFKALQANAEGGVFLYRELGGTKGQYDAGVDHLIPLDSNSFGYEFFEVSPMAASDPSSPLYTLMRNMLPAVVGGDSGKDVIPLLFGDDNLATLLMGVYEMPDPSDEPRPAYGSLECVEDEDCHFFDMMINILRPYMGLTEGQIRYLFEHTEGNGLTNAEDLFNYNLVQGFTFILPVAKSNAMSDLQSPASRTGDNAGAEICIAVKSSDSLRSLDSVIPFIQPKDIKVGTNVKEFTQGNLENVESLSSVSSIGYGRENTSRTYSLIGRPLPRFTFQDLTQPGEGELSGNTNILYDSSLSSPPKGVIGINAMDFGQNPHLVNNHQSYQPYDMFDTFFTESTVFGEIQVDFLPGSNSTTFNPLILSSIPLLTGVSVDFNRVISTHSVAIYYDDDTPVGNGRDDDGDGLIDEELYNLQDDDGDGLIDEDIGDGTPAGINGVFDSLDQYLPADLDRFGGIDGAYVFPPNSQEKYQDYITAIQPADNPLTLVDGGSLPLNLGEGSYFNELDMRVLDAASYDLPRHWIYPYRGFSYGSTYNQGMMSRLEPRTGLMDIVAMLRGGGDFELFPYYPEDLFVETPDGDIIWMLNLVSESADNIRNMGGSDARHAFALSMNAALRFPNPLQGFVRVGWTPMVVNVSELEGAQGGNDPQGENITNSPYHQFGFNISLSDSTTVSDYISSMRDALVDAYDQARTAIEDYNTAVADAEEAAADVGEGETPGEPDYPDPPDAVEVSFTDPYSAFSINNFLTSSVSYETNFPYLLQIPDEDFGPLAGNDFYVVIRSSPQARVGESFRVRIRSGQRNATLTVTDTAAGTVTTVARPEGGIAYYSYLETDYSLTADRFPGVSKNQITTSEIVVQSANVAPSLTFHSPSSGGTNIADDKFEFDISFTALDPDNVAEIQLYVDTDNRNYDGQFISGAILREGYDTTFKINMLEDIVDFDPLLSYYIYAKLDDGVNPPVYVYADAPIKTTSSSSGTDDPSSGGNTVVVTGDLKNALDYVKLKSDGLIFSLGEAPSFTTIQSTTRIVDMEVTSSFSGYVMLQVDGTALGGGDLGKSLSRVLQPNGSFLFPAGRVAFYKNDLSGGVLIQDPTETQITIESARDIEVDFTNGAIYILDGDGDMLFLGNANVNLRPEPVGIDLYRDMELGPDGKQMYFLTGNGILSAVGSASIPGWSNLVQGDIYRDMSLRVRGGVVTHVVITDANGNLTIRGSDGSVKQTLQSLTPNMEIAEGTVRQVKLFPDTDEVIMLVEGSGQPVFLTKGQEVVIPSDRLIFSDNPGLDDDRIVDTETTAINLQSVVTSVRDIIDAFNNESVERIMAYASADYKDRSGADYEGLRQKLTSFFQFFEVDSYAESKILPQSFVITNQGSTITAQVIMDLSAWYPSVFYEVPEVDQSSTGGSTTGMQLFTENPITFDQTITVREVSDGRGWLLDLYEIRNYGRRLDELLTNEDVEYDDITYLTQLPNNKRLTAYVPRKDGVDSPISVRLDINEKNPLEPYNVLAVFREPFLTRNTHPPVFEFASYTGSFLYGAAYDVVNFVFKPNSDGANRLTSMNLRLICSSNDSTFLTIDTTGTGQGSPLSDLEGTEITLPFGFSFASRGPVKAIFQGEADLIMLDGQTLQASYPLGGIMMLAENTDIYSINPSTLVGNTITRTLLKVNPYDPTTDTGGTTVPGYSATLVAGRSYFIVTADGKRYGFITIPENGIDTDGDNPLMLFDYRYEDTFVLPNNF